MVTGKIEPCIIVMLLLECLKERIIIIAHRFEEWKNVCLCVNTQRIPMEHDGTRRGCIKIRCIYRVGNF